MDDWKAGTESPGQSRGRRSPGGTAAPTAVIPYMVSRFDPYPSHIRGMSQENTRNKLVAGTNGHGDLLLTDARRNLLILGPPRSEKTAGVLMPAILSHPGPVVSTSTKNDVLRATGLVRGRLGRVWHYSPDGSPTPPGCTELRWSPIPASLTWSSAIALGKAMADIADTGAGSESASYFRTKSGVAIAALLHAAALGEKPMLWLMRAVNGESRILGEAAEILEDSLSPDSQIAASDLTGITELDDRSRGAIFATTANAFAAYRLPGALRSVERPNFDPAEFVAGDPRAWNPLLAPLPADHPTPDQVLEAQIPPTGRADTIYITSSSEQQSLVAPLVASFLSQIREATFSRHRLDDANDFYSRPPVLWALDELAGIAPMRDLPETLSQSGGQGLLVAACLQDLQMARAKWDKAADAFLTLFGNVIVLPGIRDESTLRAISTVVGKRWVEVQSEGENSTSGYQANSRGRTFSTTSQLVDALDPGAIAQGKVREHPFYVLALSPGGWQWSFCTPYYVSRPWPSLLVNTMEYVVRGSGIFERFAGIQPPSLDQDSSGTFLADAGGPDLVARYRMATQQLRGLAKERQAMLDDIGPGSLMAGYDDSWSSELPEPQRSFIALRVDPGPEKIARVMAMVPEIRSARPGEQLSFSGDARADAYMADVLAGLSPEARGHVTFSTGLQTVNIPPADRPSGLYLAPRWVIDFYEQRAGLGIVEGGLAARADTTPVRQWGGQVANTAVLIEAWSWTKPAAHMVRRLGEKLQAISPACVLDTEGAHFFGLWEEPSATDGRDTEG